VVDYADAIPHAAVGKLICDVRRAFCLLIGPAPSDAEIANIVEGNKAIASAVHFIVNGLSRATAQPPHWFRLASRPVVTRRGRPKADEALFLAVVCRQHYERITGEAAKVHTDPETKRPYGAFYDLVAAVLKALGIRNSPETAARGATRQDPARRHRSRRGAFSP
jgi:hypothetical protein